MEVFRYEVTDSTQTEAERLYKRGAVPPFFVTAAEQTAGRGRLGRSFFSPKNTGLYMTGVLEKISQGTVAVTCVAAVRIVKALEELGFTDLRIKWVNDLYRGDRKVGGIITENKQGLIFIGVGINLTTRDFPEDIRERAGSLMEEGKEIPENLKNGGSREKMLREVGEAVEKALLSLTEEECTGEDLRFYRERSFLTGKRVRCMPVGVTGTVKGIDDNGGLIVETDSGITTVTSGEVTVRPADRP